MVGGDEEVDGVQVIFGALGERKGFAHQAADPRAQGAEPAFAVAGFAFGLAATAMRSDWFGLVP